MLAANTNSDHHRTIMSETQTKILVCNSGSSSLKFSLFEGEGERLLAEGDIDWTRTPMRLVFRRTGQPEICEELKLETHADAVARILDDLQVGPSAPLRALGELLAVGHRVVHGGERYTTAVRITPEVKRVIADLAELAPLHNPVSLAGIEAVEHVLPGIPQVAALTPPFTQPCPQRPEPIRSLRNGHASGEYAATAFTD
jgi:acetate kinase